MTHGFAIVMHVVSLVRDDQTTREDRALIAGCQPRSRSITKMEGRTDDELTTIPRTRIQHDAERAD